MAKPAATISHFHVCPKVTAKVPHVGGPVIQGSPNVFIGACPPPGLAIRSSASARRTRSSRARRRCLSTANLPLVWATPPIMAG